MLPALHFMAFPIYRLSTISLFSQLFYLTFFITLLARLLSKTPPPVSSLERELFERLLKWLSARQAHCRVLSLRRGTIIAQVQVRMRILICRRQVVTTEVLVSADVQ